ncbi:NAD-dependent succinate-semialdehyde dehydrogenase [Dechloromonas denitrificans]|uniref:NAD-dependent succinate-semialdehyde dehydrogenase n=1 Tax=Dechloromonas denitrificans TaxID=281362 RepID=UPI001CF8AB22|nr:NAD-dependent succinate-semialdehyde dehydrogenase [Dechloromonas denitrificans]UCV04167.1 NAD-dependent succinate-semialdehyde dehydrogenase [Dechloromonas denitrificans]UCV08437.1 NAD-dependent succinate-semialdehyde dehydrogenase [Dechloromonas denitrificans]
MNLQNKELLRSGNFIAGQWIAADDLATLPVVNPASGLVLGEVPRCGAAETGRAIAAAEAAWPAWRALSAKQRAGLLQAWFKLIIDNADDLAQLITAEGGKPLAEARGEVIYGASFVEWFAEEGKRTYGESIPSPVADKRLLVIKQPIGVCAAITPWNFPLAMITRKVAPALAAGCPVVVKPAEATPLTALALAFLAEQAGFPAGVFNVVTGNPQAIGGALTASPVVRKLSFTGSTGVGRLLMAQCAPTVKKLSLELGGNAPFIVFDDADLDAAVDGAMTAKYRNTGQTCVCANRFLVQAGIYEAFAAKLAEKTEALKVGPGDQPGVTQGPLINAAGLAKVEAHVADAVSKGARVLAGGARHALGGNFFQPTVLADVTREMKVAREETFGPVAPLFRFTTEAEAIAMANDTEFGLAAYFFSRNIGRCWRVGEALEYGMVGINTGLISNEVAPFGGIKQSGIGREGSKYGIEEYLEIKYLCFDVTP